MWEGILNYLQHSKEYEAGLWSVTTIGFVMALVLTINPQIPALREQLAEMRNSHTLKGVSGAMIVLTNTYNVIFFLYALEIGMLGGLFNAVFLAPLYALLFAEYWKRARIPAWEWLLGCACIVLAIAAFRMSSANVAYKAVCFASLCGVASQPLNMWWRGTSEGVNIRFTKWFAFVCAVWGMYTFATGEWFMSAYGWALTACFVAATILCYRFKPKLA